MVPFAEKETTGEDDFRREIKLWFGRVRFEQLISHPRGEVEVAIGCVPI